MNWYDPDPVYTEQTLHLIGYALAFSFVLAFAWIARILTYTRNEYGEWRPADTKPPFWFYLGLVALVFGLDGAIVTRFTPFFVIMACIGVLIVVAFRITRKSAD
jgi:O-antigen/teichoic acid export membrane protein